MNLTYRRSSLLNYAFVCSLLATSETCNVGGRFHRILMRRWAGDVTGYNEPGGVPDCGMQTEGGAQPLSYVKRWIPPPSRWRAHEGKKPGKRQLITLEKLKVSGFILVYWQIRNYIISILYYYCLNMLFPGWNLVGIMFYLIVHCIT